MSVLGYWEGTGLFQVVFVKICYEIEYVSEF